MENHFRTVRLLGAVIYCAATASPLAAQESFQWTGNAGSNIGWNDADNWINLTNPRDTTSFPNAGDTAHFPASTTVSYGASSVSSISIAPGTALTLQRGTFRVGQTSETHTFNNPGQIIISDGALTRNRASLGVDGQLEITGSGELVLANESYSSISPGSMPTGDTLINASGHTIRGKGRIDAMIKNQGTIIAESGTLNINNTLENNTLIQIAADGSLGLNSTIDNTEGNIQINTGGIIRGGFGAIIGGTIDAAPGARIDGTLDSVTLTGNHAIGFGPLVLRNSLRNNSTLTVGGYIDIDGQLDLTGSGEIVFSNLDASYIRSAYPPNISTLTNGSGHTIRGQGIIETIVKNQGTIIAEDGWLRFRQPVDNTAGLIQIASDGLLAVFGTITGGTINAAPGSEIFGFDALDGVTLTGDTSLEVSTIGLRNTITNNTTLIVGDATQTTHVGISIDGQVELTGAGELVLARAYYSYIRMGSGLPSDTLTNASGHTIRGQGTITVPLINQGDLIAEGATLHIGGTYSQNTTGRLQVQQDATLRFGSTNTTIDAGTITGRGTITAANLINTGATIAPGSSPGTLTIDGNYTHQQDAKLQIEIGGTATGEFDLLDVLGNTDLQGGTLEVIYFGGNFDIDSGTVFDILTAESLTGVFDTIIVPTDDQDVPLFNVVYQPSGLIRLTAVEDISVPSLIQGDLNGDGSFDDGDISAFVQALTDPTGYASAHPDLDADTLGDFNDDGVLSNSDIAGFTNAIKALGIDPGVVPEPTSLALLGFGGLLALRRRRQSA